MEEVRSMSSDGLLGGTFEAVAPAIGEDMMRCISRAAQGTLKVAPVLGGD